MALEPGTDLAVVPDTAPGEMEIEIQPASPTQGQDIECLVTVDATDPDPADSVICGSPDFVTQRLGELQETYRFTDLLCWTRLGSLDQGNVLRSMELMQQKVMPHLRTADPH